MCREQADDASIIPRGTSRAPKYQEPESAASHWHQWGHAGNRVEAYGLTPKHVTWNREALGSSQRYKPPAWTAELPLPRLRVWAVDVLRSPETWLSRDRSSPCMLSLNSPTPLPFSASSAQISTLTLLIRTTFIQGCTQSL